MTGLRCFAAAATVTVFRCGCLTLWRGADAHLQHSHPWRAPLPLVRSLHGGIPHPVGVDRRGTSGAQLLAAADAHISAAGGRDRRRGVPIGDRILEVAHRNPLAPHLFLVFSALPLRSLRLCVEPRFPFGFGFAGKVYRAREAAPLRCPQGTAGMRPSLRRCEPAGCRRPAPGGSRSCPLAPGTLPAP